jgi:hypothetical protein
MARSSNETFIMVKMTTTPPPFSKFFNIELIFIQPESHFSLGGGALAILGSWTLPLLDQTDGVFCNTHRILYLP